ncbi:Intracellular proteinase inhibitor [Bacillus sp. THAF10]|uniref:BsuPI-related putative proteinase inhibitor n=1 Tax=Bacillus sp. THAF10 TaxID=2587848 RepID=UPI0012A9C9D1|nr:BsuPI-related putative proteinase inhibitor [Bacillus sp. THAF10]QFT90701.1 Intracellular proteinase inhibitor [Bacillus sp. THAF10]
MYKIIAFLSVFLLLAACGTAGDSSQNQTGDTNNNSEENVRGDGQGNGEEQNEEEKEKGLDQNFKEGELEGQLELTPNNEFLFTVTNNNEEDAEIFFTSGQEYDYVVFDESGATVKQLSASAMFIQATKELILQPGETLEYPVAYEEVARDLSPGTYKIHFTFTDTNHFAMAEEEFTVE